MKQAQSITPAFSIEYTAENAVLLTWPEKVCQKQHHTIIQCQSFLQQIIGDKLIDCVVSFNSLIIYYDFLSFPTKQLTRQLEQLNSQLMNTQELTGHSMLDIDKKKPIRIPVYYGEEAGWDIVNVAKAKGLSVEEVIELHTRKTYHAYALGFTPGFCYLASLDTALILPRRQSPRTKVPKGAIAIAEQQTAVYPNSSPGGWHILGQTPEAMYSSNHEGFTPKISVGRKVEFFAIEKEEFFHLGGKLVTETMTKKPVKS